MDFNGPKCCNKQLSRLILSACQLFGKSHKANVCEVLAAGGSNSAVDLSLMYSRSLLVGAEWGRGGCCWHPRRTAVSG